MNKLKNRLFAALCIALAVILPVTPVMAATLAGTVTVQTNFQYSSSVGLQSASAPFTGSAVVSLTSGTGSGQANAFFTKAGSLSSSGSDSLDLAGGIVDAFGATLTCLTVKAIVIESAAANTVDLTVGNAATNPFVGPFGAGAQTIAVRPGGIAVLVAPQTGWTVVAATGDLLKIAAGAAASTYRLQLVCTV